ncbi:MAG: fructokinase [Oceanospirillaceae bacterium]|nr:fructokinase [Oceanospirillaceae bacterium]
MEKLRIGIDLGGTKTEGVVLDEQGLERYRQRVSTPGHLGFEAVVECIATLVKSLDDQAGCQLPVGVGTPGAISTLTGTMKNCNTTCLNGRDLLGALEARLQRPVRLANDANCFALSEALDGAGADYGVVFGVIMGTGVGGGLVLHGQLHQGAQHIGGEWGHNQLEADGPVCYCGRRGCVETFISGPGLLADYHRLGGKAQSVPELLTGLEQGEACAAQAMDRFHQRFGRALATVINILDPDVVVLGGGLSNMESLYREGRDAVAEYVFNDQLITPIIRNCHGDSSGVRGAAQLWSVDEV